MELKTSNWKILIGLAIAGVIAFADSIAVRAKGNPVEPGWAPTQSAPEQPPPSNEIDEFQQLG